MFGRRSSELRGSPATTTFAVLPCCLGDNDPDLRRLGAVLEDVAADQWLLVHRDLRTLARVRRVMDAVVELFQEERTALEGLGQVVPFADRARRR